MCDINVDDFGGPCAVWSERDVTARKHHACSCCGTLIHPGERYRRHFSVHDGDPCSERLCAACAKVADDFHHAHATRPTPGFLWEILGECTDGNDQWSRALDEMCFRHESTLTDLARAPIGSRVRMLLPTPGMVECGVSVVQVIERHVEDGVTFARVAGGAKYGAKLAGNHRCQVVAVDESAFCAACHGGV